MAKRNAAEIKSRRRAIKDTIKARIAETKQARRQNMVRRVYELPAALEESILRYQEAELIPSEVEAVRQLLDVALKAKGF